MFKIGSALLVLAAGCAHENANLSAEDQFTRAYESVATGSQASAHGGGYMIERAGDSSVRVVREAPTGGLGRDISDAWITTKVKAKMATDSEVKSRNVHVDTDAGMVTLKGQVDSREQALKAVRDTLEIDGVTAVSSELRFPEQMRAKTDRTQF